MREGLASWHEVTQHDRLSVTSCIAQITLLWTARSVDAALRRSIPAFNRDVKDVQNRMEDVSFKLRIPQRKPWQGMAENVQASLVLAQQPDKVCCLHITFTHLPHLCISDNLQLLLAVDMHVHHWDQF